MTFITAKNKRSWDFNCWKLISSHHEGISPIPLLKHRQYFYPETEREGERKRERGRDSAHSIQKEVEKEFEWRERGEAECDSTE